MRTLTWLMMAVVLASGGGAALSRAVADPLTDEPAPFVPKVPRSSDENDELDAYSLFAAGRMAEKAERFQDALRLYERALRADPDALPVLHQIIALAYSLQKDVEASRYVLRLLELDPTDLAWLDKLGKNLVEQGEVESAIKLYAQARESHKAIDSPVYIAISMALGQLYQALDRNKEAADVYAEVLRAVEKPDEFGLDEQRIKKIVGNPSQRYSLIGMAMVRAGRPDDALAAFDRAEAARSDNDRRAFHLALVASVRKPPQWDEALKQLQKYFDEKGNDGGREACELFERTLAGLSRESELLERLETLHMSDPKNKALALFYADALRKAEKWDESRTAYRAILDRSRNQDAWLGMIAIERATRQAPALLDAIGDAIEKEEDGLGALGDEAKAIVAEKGLLDELIEAARTRRNSEDGLKFAPAHAMALLCVEAKNFDAASEFFEHAIKLEDSKSAELILRWALELTSAKKYADAAKVLERGIKDRALPSNNPTFYFYQSFALEMDGRTEEALTAARRAASIGENAPYLAVRIPWILYHAKRYDESEKSYLEIITQLDEDQKPSARLALREARLMLSNLSVQKKNIPEAEEWLEQVLDEFPDDVTASNDLGYLWADQGKNLDDALEMIERAVKAEPDNAAYLDSLGWVYFRLGRNEDAARELEKASANDEPDPLILDHLGDVYLKLDRKDRAREVWQKSVSLMEKEKDADAEKLKAVKEKLDRLPAALSTQPEGAAPEPAAEE